MTNRERIVNTLLGRPTDRAPFVGWLGFSPWGATLKRWRKESDCADLDIWTYFGFEPPMCPGATPFLAAPIAYGPYPPFPEEVIEETAEYVIGVDAHGIRFRQARDANAMKEFISHPIQSRGDWDRYKAERLQPRVEERLADLPAWIAKTKSLDLPTQLGIFPWGVFGTARDLLGAEEVLLDFYNDSDMIRDIMDICVGLWLALYERVTEHIAIDHIHLWEDMSGRQGSLISMKMVEEFMMPHYDRVAQFARRKGIPLLSVDTDGRVDELLPVFMRHGVNALLPFEAQAGNDVEEFGRQYPELGIMGGLDKNALAKGKAEIHAQLDRAERMLARGRYIAGFDHSIPPNVPWDNFRYFVENLKKIIGV